MALAATICLSSAMKDRLNAANSRFGALAPRVEAALGRDRFGQIGLETLSNPGSFVTPSCDVDRTGRRVVEFEQAVDRLEAALDGRARPAP